MNIYRFFSVILMTVLLVFCAAFLCGCKNPVMYSQYEVILPEIPPDWERVLGMASWHIEWVDKDGNWRKKEIQQDQSVQLEICNTKINPVIAYPYWPEKNIYPKTFYPAGGIFPLDANEDAITLDWQGGIDAQLYIYLSGFNNGRNDNSRNRPPEQFDWQRFRFLLRQEIKDTEIKLNPWNVDWKTAAERIARSGFRSTYISSRDFTDITVTIPESGLWISPSPFYKGQSWEAGESVVLKADESTSRYISAKGTIVFNNKTWDYFKGYY